MAQKKDKNTRKTKKTSSSGAVLRNPKNSKATKIMAGSALTQRPGKVVGRSAPSVKSSKVKGKLEEATVFFQRSPPVSPPRVTNPPPKNKKE